AEDGIRDDLVTGVQTCALPIFSNSWPSHPELAGSVGPPSPASGGRIMRGSWRFVVAIGFVAMMLGGSGSVEAFIDDMEEDAWLRSEERRVGKEGEGAGGGGMAK